MEGLPPFLRCQPEQIMRLIVRFAHDQAGATVIEYGLICSLLFLAITGAVTTFGSRSTIMYGHIAANMH